jgi:peptide/nickel transport system substrate-binding protein
MTRRGFITRAAALGLSVPAASSILAACGSSSSDSGSSSTATGGNTAAGASTATTSASPSAGGATSASPSADAAKPQDGGTITITMGADATGLDPESVLNNNSGYAMAMMYDGLTAYKRGTTEVGPSLAEKWEISDDAKTYTFHLTQGVKFHDDTDFNADAAVAWLDRLLNKSNAHYYGNQKGIDSYVDFTFGEVASYKKSDDSTLEVTMKQPHAAFLASLAMVWSGVTSPAAVEKYGYDLQKNPVGTGPFSFVEWVPNDHITVKKNPNYWGGKPHLDKVILQIVPEPSTQLLKLKSGEVQIITDPAPESIADIKKDSKLQLLTQPGLTVLGVALPVDHAPYSDKRVRQALNYAIDKDDICQHLFAGLAEPMGAPEPKVEWAYDETLSPFKYDPEKAKSLLKEANFDTSKELTFWVYGTTRSYNPAGGTRVATALQGYWGKVGINVKLQQLEWGAFLSKSRDPKLSDMALTGWSGDNGDPGNFVTSLYGTSGIPEANQSHYSVPDVDKLLDQAEAEPDHDKRSDLYEKAQGIIWSDCPWVWLVSTTQTKALSAKVHGLTLNPTQMYFNMNDVWLER